MKRPLFVLFVVLGIIGFYVMKEMEVKYSFALAFIYLGIIFQLRRWYLIRHNKWSYWHFWDPRNIFDQFKKP